MMAVDMPKKVKKKKKKKKKKKEWNARQCIK